MKGVLDTNSLVAAVLVELEQPYHLLEAWRHRGYTLVTSHAILAELRDVLHRPRIRNKYRAPTDERIGAFVAFLRGEATLVPGTTSSPVTTRDPGVEPAIVAAIESQADYLVTRDNDLLSLPDRSLRPHAYTRIVTPPEFSAVLRQLRDQ